MTVDRRRADCRLVYVGHTGTGFDGAELTRVVELLKPREIRESPFSTRVPTNERPHWVRPELVAQVRFTEWTDDNKLRHPVYLGLRDDKEPLTVVREEIPQHTRHENRITATERTRAGIVRQDENRQGAPRRLASLTPKLADSRSRIRHAVVDQLRALEDTRKDGAIELPDGERLSVTNLAKLFWPKLKLTKGDLLRYYATVAPLHAARGRGSSAGDEAIPERRRRSGVLPAAPREEKPPPGVRIETLDRRARADLRAGRPPADRRVAHHAALHDADRRDLAGPVVLARAVAARRRLRRARSRSGRRRDVRAGARRRATGSATSCTR